MVLFSLLYVDDEPALLEIAKLFLERTGEFSVRTCTSATEALSLLQETTFDTIISDYQMPGMDGIAFLKKTREISGLIPFILFTGRGREEVVIEAINNGADFYLQKGGEPVSQFAELAHKIRLAIRRRMAEVSIRDHERREEDIINFLPDATFAIDINGVVIAWNHAIEEMTGISAAEMLGKGDYEYAIPFYQERRPIIIDLILQDDPAIAAQYSSLKRDGLTLTGEATSPDLYSGRGGTVWSIAAPLYNNQGKIIGAIESIRDITDRKQTEEELLKKNEELGASNEQVAATEEELRANLDELTRQELALRESEEKFRTLFESAGDAIFIMDNTAILDCNRRAEEIYRCNRDQIVGHSPADFSPERQPDGQLSAEKMKGKISAAILGEKRFFEWVHVHDNGIPFNVEVSLNRVMVWGTYYLQAIVRDITEQKRVVEALQESENRFRLVLETLPIGFWLADHEGRLLLGNPAGEQIWEGQPRVGQEEYEIFKAWRLPGRERIQPDDWALGYAVNEGRTTTNELLEIEAFDGTHKFILNWAAPVKKKDGEIIGAFVINQDMTDRILAERSLKKSEERFRTLVETSPDMVWEIDAMGRFTYISPQSTQSLGYSPEELVGRLLFSLIPADTLPSVQAALEQHLKNREDLNTLEVPAHHRDGRLLNLEIRSSPVRNDQGDTVGFRGIARDITERKQAEERIRRFQIFAENARDIILFIRKSDGQIVEANRAASRTYGYSHDELLGMRVSDLRDSSDQALLHAQMDQAVSEGILFETVHKRKDQTLVPMEVNSFGTRFDGGPVLLSICRDITERKRSEDEVRAALEQITVIEEELRQNFEVLSASQQHLYDSEEKFRSLAENSQDCIMRFDRQYRYLYMNPTGLRASGLQEDLIVGKNLLESRLDEALVPEWERKIQQVFDTGEPVQVHISREGAEGQIMQDLKLMPDFDRQGSIKSVLGVARDITELKQIESALRRGNQQLNLLSSVTRHDIMNKILVMQANLDFAKDESLDKDGVAMLIENLEGVTRVIQSLIGFTSIYQNLGIKEPAWQQIAGLLPTASLSPPIRFQTDLDDVEVYADPMLEKVFYNLLDNSIRHGKKVTRVRVSSFESAGDLVLVWEDDGVGIPKKEKELIFQRGYGKNTGFGAFLIREILALTNCTITETGTPGTGARFEIVVPQGAYRRSGRA